MPRTLAQAAIQRGIFAKAEHVEAQPFYVLGATYRDKNSFGQSDVVLRLLLRDGVYDENANLHKFVLVSLTTNGNDQRMEFVRYFRTETERLGPLVMRRLPAKQPGMNGFILIEDIDPADIKLIPPGARNITDSYEPGDVDPTLPEPEDDSF